MLRLPAAHRRRPLELHDDGADARRRSARATSSSARTPRSARERPAAARGDVEPDWLVVRDLAGDRVGVLVVRRPGDRVRRAAAPRTSGPRSSSSPPPRTPRRTARSPTRSGCCSGATRPSSRRATAARSCASSSTSGAASASGSPGRPTRGTGRCSTSPGTTRRGRTTSRTPRPCCRRSTAATADGESSPSTRSCRTTARRRAARGSTPASTRTASTRPARRKPRHASRTGSPPSGAGRGRPNRRMLYNRASADPDGKPWSERKRYVWWDAERGPVDRPRRRPGLRARQAAGLRAAARTRRAWRRSRHDAVHRPPRRARLDLRALRPRSTARCRRTTSRTSRRSTTRSTARQTNPTRQSLRPAREPDTTTASGSEFPVRAHDLPAHRAPHGRRHVADLPYLSELQPELFCEVSPALRPSAASSTGAGRRSHGAHRDRGARDGHRPDEAADGRWARVVHQVGLPYHWGWQGLVTGDVVNELLALRSTRTSTSRSQGATCDIRPGGAARPALTRSSPSTAARERDGATSELDAARGPHLRRRGEPRVGLLHRHVAVHRLQGVRGRLQGVEPRPGHGRG